jgi:glutamate synthase domain-containing protein 1/glutamate synthase domain-containing protein 3
VTIGLDRVELARRLIASRRALAGAERLPRRKAEGEGGCGVIGIAASDRIAGRHLLQALRQMRNRGNGKGGGIAAAGLEPGVLGADAALLARDYLLAVAYLDPAARAEVEEAFIGRTFVVDHAADVPERPGRPEGVDIAPPRVRCYFVRVRDDVRERWARAHGLEAAGDGAVDDEIVYQHTYRLNRAFYASTGERRAFVLSHGRDLLVLKMVGYGDDVVRHYRLEDVRAHVWIGHHRYPTKGRVWHPGGAHPFIGMHEALVHNGDFANYASIVSYLAQRNVRPLFLTDTEVAVLVFDLLHRVYGYPLEYVIEAMAPTTERDFAMLPPDRRRVYAELQAVHMHGSPDGPWFFLVAQSDAPARTWRLIGITDTSMLRPQVFALQRGAAAVGFAASEKQAIDAALESLAAEDARFWPAADLYWNARGGSHTDGGAFLFTVRGAPGDGPAALVCTDKFGRAIAPDSEKLPPPRAAARASAAAPAVDWRAAGAAAEIDRLLPAWSYEDLDAFLETVSREAGRDDEGRAQAIAVLTRLVDRRGPTGRLKRSAVVSAATRALGRVFDDIRARPSARFVWVGHDAPLARDVAPDTTVVIDARGFRPEGEKSLARAIVDLYCRGARRLVVAHARGHRFIGCGLGPGSDGLRIDVYGSPGDYLASGIDGAEIVVHASGQDQLAQIMKAGRLVVHGDVGQTFMYGAKGGSAFVLGNAAGRPLINAVGRPRVVINGTCLDYLAESFMAGDPLDGGGFVVLNGLAAGEDGTFRDLETPYPGGNLFSLASGGAIYVRDPRGRVGDDQLNGGAFVPFEAADWALIRPHLEENERLFGIAVSRLLEVDGAPRPPERVYRKIAPSGHEALAPEEAWVREAGAAHSRSSRR